MGLVLLLTLSNGGPFMAVKQADLADAAETEAAKVNTALAREKKAKENVQRTLGGYETTITQLVAMTKSEKLLQDPRFKPVLMKLLEHALAHFQRFIKEHKNDQSTKMRVRLTPKQRFEQPVPDPEKCPKSCPRSVEFIG